MNPNSMHGLSNQYQSSLQAALLASASNRPISWHPSSTRSRGLSNPTYADYPGNYNGMDAMNDPNFNLLSVYANDMPPCQMPTGPALSPEDYVPFYLENQGAMAPQPTPALSIPSSQVEPMTWDTAPTPTDMSMQPTTSDGWSLDMLSMANVPPAETTCPSYVSVPSPGDFSGPSTPNFLPIQQFDDVPAPGKKSEKQEEELVGMGLYNQPDGSFGQSQQGLLGKGLKLEDSFSPSDDENDEEEEDEPEAAPQQQHMSPEQPAPAMQQPNMSLPKQPSKQALNLLHKSFFFDHDDLDQQTMTAAQPFNINPPCMSYGYGWI